MSEPLEWMAKMLTGTMPPVANYNATINKGRLKRVIERNARADLVEAALVKTGEFMPLDSLKEATGLRNQQVAGAIKISQGRRRVEVRRVKGTYKMEYKIAIDE